MLAFFWDVTQPTDVITGLQSNALLHTEIREFGIRKGLKKLVISSKIRIFIGENQ